MCLPFFHKWTKWEVEIRKYELFPRLDPTLYIIGPGKIEYTVIAKRFQIRHCLYCGLTQERRCRDS